MASVTESTALWTVVSPTQRGRILTSVSSRCGEVFSMVAPDPGALGRRGRIRLNGGGGWFVPHRGFPWYHKRFDGQRGCYYRRSYHSSE